MLEEIMGMLNYQIGVIKKKIVIIVFIFIEVFLVSLSNAQTNTFKRPLYVAFSDSVFINNPVIIDFFKNYLYRYRDTTQYNHFPILVCQINKYNDTLILTLTGYGDYNDIIGTPTAFFKINNKVVLLDFGLEGIIDSCSNRINILDRLHLSPINRYEGYIFHFPTWQLKYISKDNYVINRRVRPPGLPPPLNLPDSVIYIPPSPQSY